MVIINKYEEILSGKRPFNGDTDNEALFIAYAQNKISNNERLDLNDVIADEEVRPIAETVRRLGIKEFTISAGSFGIIRTLAAFAELGIKTADIITINSRFNQRIPAFLMKGA